MTAESIFNRWSQIAEIKPQIFNKISGSNISWHINGAGHWNIDCRAEQPKIAQNSARATVELEMKQEDFLAINRGLLEPQVAFARGLLKAKGDEITLLKFSLILRDLISLSGGDAQGDTFH